MCPVSCGEGALRRRSVMCVSTSRSEDEPELALPDQDCDADSRPEEVEPCPDLPLCEPLGGPVVVYAGEDEPDADFYNVSRSTRYNGSSEVSSEVSTEASTEILEPPEILEFDNVVDGGAAEEWQVSKWSHCLGGRRSRKVSCSAAGAPTSCKLESRPADSEECFAGKWVTGESDIVLILSRYHRLRRWTSIGSDDLEPGLGQPALLR